MPVESVLYPMTTPKEGKTMEAQTQHDRDFMDYYIEPLPGDRAQLHCDVVIQGELVPALGGPVGSPAPAESVRPHARRVTLALPR
jgi:hypothetical protein